MRGRTWFALGLAVVVAATLCIGGSFAGAEEEPGGGMPQPQKKIDHPLVKHLVGTWDWSAAGEMPGKGTFTWQLGLGDTAVIEDLNGKFAEMDFFGHGIWKVSDDGKSVTMWWIDNMSAEADSYKGTLTADGYSVKNAKGDDMVLTKTDAGLELKLHGGAMTITFTKK